MAGGKTECGRCGLGRAGESNEGKMGTTVIEQQFKKETKCKKNPTVSGLKYFTNRINGSIHLKVSKTKTRFMLEGKAWVQHCSDSVEVGELKENILDELSSESTYPV